MWITKRDSLILVRLIETYISTHQPVSSAQLAPLVSLSCSTVRKELQKNDVKSPVVAFGTDTGISDLDDFIFIFSNFYYSQNPIGNIGIIGPKFMAYPNTISQVEVFSSYFSRILSNKPMEV